VSASPTPTSLPLSRFIDPVQMYQYRATGRDPTLATPHRRRPYAGTPSRQECLPSCHALRDCLLQLADRVCRFSSCCLRMPPGFAPLPVVHLPTASCVVSTSLVTPHVAPLQVYTPLSSVSLPDTYFTASVWWKAQRNHQAPLC
jgi:hypothetical protein